MFDGVGSPEVLGVVVPCPGKDVEWIRVGMEQSSPSYPRWHTHVLMWEHI